MLIKGICVRDLKHCRTCNYSNSCLQSINCSKISESNTICIRFFPTASIRTDEELDGKQVLEILEYFCM